MGAIDVIDRILTNLPVNSNQRQTISELRAEILAADEQKCRYAKTLTEDTKELLRYVRDEQFR